MNPLADQVERDRFIGEPSRNISVIAPAGVGKTQAIIERIVRLAQQSDTVAADRLSRLIVVTYSVRAAQEMQQRARAAIRKAGVSPRVHRAFQQTFFGTIHSYCVRLLDRFGHYLGIPSAVALLQADDELWNRFLVRGLGEGIAPDSHLNDLFHFYPPDKLYALGKEIAPGRDIVVGPLPDIDLAPVLDYDGDGLHHATKRSVTRAQAALKQWWEGWAKGDRFRQPPACPGGHATEFAELWHRAFEPLHAWLREGALAFGRRIANAYESFRLSEGVMTYDDQVRLALRALGHASVRRELAAERLSVLLDEAQDTDPQQFEVLSRVAGLHADQTQSDDQSFCIVGDFQQAIYAPRSDLAVYRRMHKAVSAEPRGTSSCFTVTFRCDQAIIDFVNRVFPPVLDDVNGQCAFVELSPRPDVSAGQVVRWECPDEPDHQIGKKINAAARAMHEARFLAQRIKELGPQGLGASTWSQVAILCPRRQWLREIGRELRELGLPIQLHSSNERQKDMTPAAWLTSLIWIAAHPEDSFEIAGVLREILGISDHDMAIYSGGDGDRLRLDRPVMGGDHAVARALTQLRDACDRANALPLHETVRRLIDITHLRERLRSIAEEELGASDRELDDLLASILARCAEGVLLADLAAELRQGLVESRPAEEEIRDAIQLLTSHKAKGLEWEAVIVSYTFRSIESKSPPYPRLIRGEGDSEIVCRDNADFITQARDRVIARERQQLQRLLYVMCTRARHTLVLVDDEALFDGQMRRGGWSFGELLGILDGANGVAWKALPGELSPLVVSTPETLSVAASRPETLPDIQEHVWQRAIQRANAIPRRLTPHTLASHVAIEAEPGKYLEQVDDRRIVGIDNPGTLYGTWWHEFVQQIPWQKPMSSWEQAFTEALKRSPLPDRSQREWELFRESRLARWLAEPDRLIQPEFPFLWRKDEMQCIEGVMDLAVHTAHESAWHVIDWKTNRIGPAGSADIVDLYRGQIAAYVRVLREILSAEVRGSLYLTQTGEWVELS